MIKGIMRRSGILTVLAVFVIQAIICLYVAQNKEFLFTDEVYSYGLANSETTSFIDPGNTPALLDAWQDGSYFKKYISFDTDRNFSFHAAFVNQANDVHPPLYYCFLHLICAFFSDNAYSAIPGILLNMVFLLIADILLYYIAGSLLHSKLSAAGVLIFWGLSASCIGNAVLIRMYMLQTAQILALIAYHIYQGNKNKHTVIDAIGLIALVAAGGLTHYYFYVFAAALGFCICLYLLFSKRYKLFTGYAVSLWGGVAAAAAVFPAALTRHINGYRGKYATDSMGSISLFKFRRYFYMIDNELFAGLVRKGIIVIAFCIVFIILLYSVKSRFKENTALHRNFLHVSSVKKLLSSPQRWITDNESSSLLLSVIFASAVYFYVAVQCSEVVNVRYIYPLFPIGALFVFYLISIVCKGKNIGIICCLTALIIAPLSIYTNGIDYSYLDYKDHKAEAESLKNNDCVIINSRQHWWNVLYGSNIYSEMNEVRALYDTDLEHFPELLAERASDDNALCIAFSEDNEYTDDEEKKILDTILEETEYTKYEQAFDYHVAIYVLE